MNLIINATHPDYKNVAKLSFRFKAIPYSSNSLLIRLHFEGLDVNYQKTLVVPHLTSLLAETNTEGFNQVLEKVKFKLIRFMAKRKLVVEDKELDRFLMLFETRLFKEDGFNGL